MDSITVLMSTYNGESYLREQIDSILGQRDVELYLVIRDDGSNDTTLEILQSYVHLSNVRIIEGNNVGAAKSFFELIKIAMNSDYYAFADQDDVWDADKLSVAINMIKNYSQIPCIYSSNTRLVDKNLRMVKVENDNPLITLESAFIKNYCTGCTSVFNRSLMNEFKIYQPEYVVMHDWWINILALSLGGESIYDFNAHINYRQHGKNVSGAELSYWRKCINRALKFKNMRYRRDVLAREILDNYENKVPIDNREVLRSFANNSWKMIFIPSFRCRKVIDTILFKICVLFNRI
ncbi:MAG: glycosyltransferase family 2 protein [Lachnospiraceae bacterium]|nr:glycosyltransferase family 2 protein [Lachnospiraceae bacterium]